MFDERPSTGTVTTWYVERRVAASEHDVTGALGEALARRRGRARDRRTDRLRPARPAGGSPRLHQPAAGREAPSTDRRRGRGRTVVAGRCRPRGPSRTPTAANASRVVTSRQPPRCSPTSSVASPGGSTSRQPPRSGARPDPSGAARAMIRSCSQRFAIVSAHDVSAVLTGFGVTPPVPAQRPAPLTRSSTSSAHRPPRGPRTASTAS